MSLLRSDVVMQDEVSRRLLIISDSPMWKVEEGRVFVFEPTLREVEYLAGMFSHITWIGYNHGRNPKGLARLTDKPNISFFPLASVSGGETLFEKMSILPRLPKLWRTLSHAIRSNDYIHTRGPSVPALIAVLQSYCDKKRRYWHKYAGNWKQRNAPLAYGLQRHLLRRCPHIVTVNGYWRDEPANIVNLENPCLTDRELKEAADYRNQRSFRETVNLCFVGALTRGKGIWEFLRAISLLSHKEKIGQVCIAGDGPLRPELEAFAATLEVPVFFLGSIRREEINRLYERSDLIVLPTVSEGFPKVVAEAAAFGCIPIVSDVSSISQHIKTGVNGVLLSDRTPEAVAGAIDGLSTNMSMRINMVRNLKELPSLFTYERYCRRLCSIMSLHESVTIQT